ncbi:hypothetical protein CALCODRAFT_485139 [Calocera cornea HHB12733]|uniref:Uncharacterized protein n=1 Tax=Calocera cornea HHB12733 TaxID=1353952 RepID=A0A165EJN3_9BASI|nr:hypothetical protein CALCODRAFT_485139 [Calocera cornea HHB12733]
MAALTPPTFDIGTRDSAYNAEGDPVSVTGSMTMVNAPEPEHLPHARDDQKEKHRQEERALTGPPISGAIYDRYGSFHQVGFYAGSMVIGSCVLLAGTKYAATGSLWAKY